MTKQDKIVEYFREYEDTHPDARTVDFDRPNGDTLIVYQNYNGGPVHMRFVDKEGNMYLVCRGKKVKHKNIEEYIKGGK